MCIGMIALKLPKIDGDFQLVPFARQPVVLRLEAGVDVGKLSTKPDHRVHRLAIELEVDSAAPAHQRQCTTKPFFGPGSR